MSEEEFLGGGASAEYLVLVPSIGKMIALDRGGPLEKASSGARVRLHMKSNHTKKHRNSKTGSNGQGGSRKNLHQVMQDSMHAPMDMKSSTLSWDDDIDDFSFLPSDGSSFGQVSSLPDGATPATTSHSQNRDGQLEATVATAALPLNMSMDASSIQPDTQISMVVFVLDMCGKGGGPVGSNLDVENLLFHNDLNLADYFDTCSNGRAMISPDNTLVLSVSMPCNGTNSGVSWSVSSCTAFDYYGWQLWLMDWSASQGIDVSPYAHHVAILPREQASFMQPASECSFTGIGVIGPVVSATSYGPGVFSFAWISGDFWDQPQSWMHEIGHNYFLRHADTMQTRAHQVGGHSSPLDIR